MTICPDKLWFAGHFTQTRYYKQRAKIHYHTITFKEEKHLVKIIKYVFLVKPVRSIYYRVILNILTGQSLRRGMTELKFFWPVIMTSNSSKFILSQDIIQ